MPHALLADVVTAVHLAVVVFMILGLILTLIGGARRWRWVRAPLFRLPHLAIMAYIAFNAVRGELCFLTHLEHDLRASAGQSQREDWSFVGRVLHDVLFVEADQALLHGIYLTFGGLVVLSLWLVPPRRRRTILASAG